MKLASTRERDSGHAVTSTKLRKNVEQMVQKGTQWRDKTAGLEHLGCLARPLRALVGAFVACVDQNGVPEVRKGAKLTQQFPK